MQPRTKIFSHLVKDYMRRSPVVVSNEARVSELLERMAAARRASALVVDSEGRLSGIVTEQDVTRRIALRCDGSEPVGDIATTPAKTVHQEDYLYYAIARMRRFGWRHMPVVDREYRPVGMIDLSDALTVAGDAVIREIELISQDDTLDGLRQVKAAQVELASSLFDDNVAGPEIQAVISHINWDIHARLLDTHLAAMADAGWGKPPVDFALLIMGSGGRGENYLYPDQDNGFILDDYPDADHARIDGFFIELAERLTRDLNTIGFPYCNGYVMATNPIWRKTRSQWRQQVDLWRRRRSTVVVQLADIFFDFQGTYGQIWMAEELRGHVTRMTQSSPALLTELDREISRIGVALGWFGRLAVEKDKPGHKGEVNLKHSGTLPLVSSLRLLALQAGITETASLARIAALEQVGALTEDEADYLSGAFNHITGLLLRQQVTDFRAGREVSNFVPPDELSERETDILVDSLKAIDDFAKRVHSSFSGEYF
jgi:signal-transduction protein with cAMP-binding, CBS, and nucleotidyltransferase domain